ncbi:hypothetical protein [Actinoplanes hulinensis]|uniref:hypothetical protein n=1 Tax=Actinoplanes hulinensis TaxID=1144547 RepID=UPI001FE67A70|nr:hypothetical protein [Actinoplanes hulinensis]
MVRHVPAVATKVLDATSPRLEGPLVDKRLAGKARGTLLPLTRIGPDGVLVDRLLGPGFSFLATIGTDLPDQAGRLPLTRVFIDPAPPVAGERRLAAWLGEVNASWTLIRPDRTVYAVGRSDTELAPALAKLGPDLTGATA